MFLVEWIVRFSVGFVGVYVGGVLVYQYTESLRRALQVYIYG